MTGLIKMYFYRMSRSVGLVISLFLCCLCVFLPAIEQKIPILSMFIENNTITVSSAALHVLSQGLPCAVCAIYLSALFSADHANGFIKNIIPSVRRKSAIFFARTAVTLLFFTVIYLLVCTLSYLFYGVIKGRPVGLDAINTMTIFTRGMVMSVIFAISSMTGFTTVPVAVGEAIVFMSDPRHEAVAYTYLVSYMMKNITSGFSSAKIFAMCAVYVVISVAVSLSVLSLRDEK